MSSGAFLTSRALKGRSLRGVRSSCQSCDGDAPLWQSYRLRKSSAAQLASVLLPLARIGADNLAKELCGRVPRVLPAFCLY